ncbi:hypothetical protein HDU97_009222 [Phlyctochytrium planicorne]|nr:hypothetical protein HDU97_009222 [Phlyctochytrium planicorne]
MAVDNKFLAYGTPAILLLSLILAIVSTAKYWYVADRDNGFVVFFGPYESTVCKDAFCQSLDFQACSEPDDSFGGKTACSQLSALKGLTVVADMTLFLALAAVAFVHLKGRDAPKMVSWGAVGITFVATIFLFTAMCIGASFKDSKYLSAIKFTLKLSLGFFLNILAWICSGAAAVGAFLIMQATR